VFKFWKSRSWRPAAAGGIVLSDSDLAKIGLTAVLEARAKSAAAAALKVVEGLSHDDWIRLERVQFSQISERLIKAAEGKDDEFRRLVQVLDQARKHAHGLRHMVIHVTWGQHGDAEVPLGHDFGRARNVTASDIQAALEGCAEMSLAARRVTYRAAELIVLGQYAERAVGTKGISMFARDRWVRL
jgi:hypothetical protein